MLLRVIILNWKQSQTQYSTMWQYILTMSIEFSTTQQQKYFDYVIITYNCWFFFYDLNLHNDTNLYNNKNSALGIEIHEHTIQEQKKLSKHYTLYSSVQWNKYWKYILIMTRVLLTLFLHYKYYCFSYFQTEISNANTTFYCKFSVYIFALEIKLKKKKTNHARSQTLSVCNPYICVRKLQ